MQYASTSSRKAPDYSRMAQRHGWWLLYLALVSLVFPAWAAAAEDVPEREWTLMVYAARANDLESHAFRDLARLTASHSSEPDTLALSMLISTTNHGNWQLGWDGHSRDLSMRRLDKLYLYELDNLRRFIRDSAARFPARRYALIMQGHGAGWYLSIEPRQRVSSAAVAAAVRQSKVPFELIGFDMGLMSSLETAWEFRGLTRYLIASQDYSSWEGIISPRLIKQFSRVPSSRELATGLLASFIERNASDNALPTDISLLDMAGVQGLVDFVKKAFEGRQLDESYLNLGRPVDRTSSKPPPYLQDLYGISMQLLDEDAAAKEQFEKLFRATVIEYRQNTQKQVLPDAAQHHGLSIAMNAEEDPADEEGRYRELSLPLRLMTLKPATP